MRPALFALPLLFASALAASSPPVVQREEAGNRISENIPAPSAALLDQLNRYQNTRGANFAGWSGNDALLWSHDGSQLAFTSAMRNGRDVWYLVFTDEGHGFAKKTNNDWFNAATAMFWQRHLLGQNDE